MSLSIKEINEQIEKINQEIKALCPNGETFNHVDDVTIKIKKIEIETEGSQNEINELTVHIRQLDENIKLEIERFNRIKNNIQHVRSQNDIDEAMKEINSMHSIIAKLQGEMKESIQERDNIYEQAKSQAERLKAYIKITELIKKREGYGQTLQQLEEKKRVTEIEAYQRNTKSSGRTLSKVDLLFNLRDSENYEEWKENFCRDRNYSVTTDTADVLRLVPDNNTLPTITIDHSGISTWSIPRSPEDIEKSSQVVIRTYMQCIKEKDLMAHKVTSQSDECLKSLEITLARALMKSGNLENAIINDKKVSDILGIQKTSTSTIEVNENSSLETNRPGR